MPKRDRILVLRPARQRPHAGFVRWLAEHDRDLHDRLVFRAPGPWIPLRRVALVLNWQQDPLSTRPLARGLTRALEVRARALGIAVLQPGAALDRGRKSVQSRILRDAGFDTPPVGPIAATAFPLVVRSDVTHAGDLLRCDTPDVLARADLSAVREPVASPFVETRGPDGFYRKRRYFLADGIGAPRHLQVSSHWLVRMDARDQRPAFVEEELRYTGAPDPNHDLLERARRALGLDWVAFDYSERRAGGIVIWEANPQPTLWVEDESTRPENAYRRAAIERVFGVWRDAVRVRLG
jgi:hypothetical protein